LLVHFSDSDCNVATMHKIQNATKGLRRRGGEMQRIKTITERRRIGDVIALEQRKKEEDEK